MNKNPNPAWKCALILISICYLLFTVSARIYLDTDNITVAVVTNGLYGDNNFCQYLHPLICVLIKYLDMLIPSADMYTVLIHLLVFTELYFLAYVAADYLFQAPFQSVKSWNTPRILIATLLTLGILFLSTSLNLWNVNYTVQTASLMMTGMILFAYAEKYRKSRKWTAAGTVLICIAFMLRLKGALLFIPYILLEWGTRIIMAGSEWKVKIRVLAGKYMPAMLSVVVILAGQIIFNSFEPYKTAVRHNHFRETVVDFPMREYDETDPAFSGISEAEYEAAIRWILCDTDVMTADQLERLANAGKSNSGFKSPEEFLGDMSEKILTLNVQLYLFLAITILIFLTEIISVRNKWLRIEACLAFLGSFIILLHFTYRGRTPERIWESIFLAADGIFIIIAMKSDTWTSVTEKQTGASLSTPKSFLLLLLCAGLWFSIGQYIAEAELHAPVTALTARVNADDSIYERTYAPSEDGKTEAVYLWPWWSETIPDYFSGINKLPTQRVIEHNIAMGDWVYGQPYFTDFLERIDCVNPMKALLNRPETYLVAGIHDEVVTYLSKEYGEEVTLEDTGKIDEWIIYRVVRKMDQ